MAQMTQMGNLNVNFFTGHNLGKGLDEGLQCFIFWELKRAFFYLYFLQRASETYCTGLKVSLYFLPAVFLIFCMLYFIFCISSSETYIGWRELKRASGALWGSLQALKRTNQHFSYFMRSLRAVSVSVCKGSKIPRPDPFMAHSTRTHHHCGLNRLLTLISSIGAPLWPKQTTHFYTIHRAESHHNTIVSSESDQNRLFALHMAQLVSNCNPHQKIDIILTMTEKTIEELKLGPRSKFD